MMKREGHPFCRKAICSALAILLLAGAGCGNTPSSSISSSETAATETTPATQTTAATTSTTAPASEATPEPASDDGWQPIPDTSAQGEAGTLQEIYKPKYAKGFSIEYYYGGAKIVATDIQATASTEAFSQRLLILPEGAAEPKDAAYDFAIKGDVERVITFASSHAGHFALLDETGLIKGTSIKEDSCYIPSLKQALETGSTVYVGSGKNADKELIASLQPQIVTVGGMASDTEIAKKLEESGIFCLYFGDFAEDSYLGRAQWAELVGALCGKEQEAQDKMKENEKAANSVIERAAAIEEKPTVLWYTHSSDAPHWNLRTSSDYVNSMVSALGGKMIFPEGTTTNSVKLSNEDFLPLMMEADKIIFGVSLNSYKSAADMTYFNKEGQIDFSQSKAYQNGDCYVVGYDWAQDTANVKSIMESLAIALYPDEFKDLENSGKIMKFDVTPEA